MESRPLLESSVPRAEMGLSNDGLGFAAASRRLALRRSAVIFQEDNPSEVMPSNFPGRLPMGHSVPEYLQGCQSKESPVNPRKIHQYRTLAEADLERSQLNPDDQFETHDLDEQLLGDLCQQLQRYPIAQAELVKKTLRFFPEQPLYVLLVCPAAEQLNPSLELTLGTQIAQELRFSRELLVCLTSDTEPQLVNRIQAKSTGNLLNLVD